MVRAGGGAVSTEKHFSRCHDVLHIMSVLDEETAEGKYPALENLLLCTFGLSPHQRASRLLHLDGLGNRTLSALMDEMLALAEDHKPGFLFRQIFLKQMPRDIQLILVDEDFMDARRVSARAVTLWCTKRENEAALSQVARPRASWPQHPPKHKPEEHHSTWCFYHQRWGAQAQKQLKDNSIYFGHGAIQHFAKIAEGVNQLEEARRSIHEMLEVETIEASKLRYKLSELPNKLKQQIAAAVAAARESKATYINELKVKIETMTEQIEALGKEYCRLEQDNTSLFPVHQEAGAQYNDIIFLINNVMGDRANKQITLNETYDNIQDVKQKIIDVMRDIAELKEEMDKKRNEFKTKKKSSMAKFTEIYQLVQDQNTINFKEKTKLDELKVEVDNLNNNLSVQEEVRLTKTAQSRMQKMVLKKQESVLQIEHSENLKAVGELFIKKGNMTEELNTLSVYYKKEIENLQTRSLQAQRDIDNAKTLNQELAVRRQSRSEAARKAKEHEFETRKSWQSLTERLGSLKGMFVQTEENLSSKRKEIQELEEMMLNLDDVHKDTMEFLNEELQKYVQKLEKEKQLRIATHHKRDEIAKEMLDIKRTTEEYLTNLSRRLQALKKKREKLIGESKNFQKNIDEYTERIPTLKQLIAAKEDAFKIMERILSAEIRHLKNEIKEIKEKTMRLQKDLEEKLPIQQKLESEIADETATCDELQKELNDIISKKSNIDNTITRLKRETGILLVSKCNLQLMRDLASLEKEGERQKIEKENQDQELQIIYDNLIKSWALDFSVQKEFAACDQCILNAIEKLKNKIQLREIKLGSIGDQLKEHLSKLLSFVGSTHSAGRPRTT
ncbi:coiled-coil domain-containing protein 175 isoform X2 [Narcine bancroftii]|uniref:coiled-coil domain-containing protein 175 isoform X2 n=1 Tax=Narcine bancroftii TaxID=1343680 RepID=UPI00383178B5